MEGKLGDDFHTNAESLQIDDNLYLESIEWGNYLNHSCNPNCFIDFKELAVISMKNIKKDEELTYNYNTSEYDLVNLVQNCSFYCKCNSKNCINEVKGFRYLSIKEKIKIKKFI